MNSIKKETKIKNDNLRKILKVIYVIMLIRE